MAVERTETEAEREVLEAREGRRVALESAGATGEAAVGLEG